MYKGKKILAVIPARGGSKGIPRKNIKELGGKPLIAWTIECAKKSKYLDRIIVSTDDEEIARIAKEWGADVPFMRPAELAQDDTPGIAPILHAAEFLKGEYTHIVVLQVTSPFRSANDVDETIKKCIDNVADTCVSVTKAEASPFWMYTLDEGEKLKPLLKVDEEFYYQRQKLPVVYQLNGAVYVVTSEYLLREKKMISNDTLGYVMVDDRSLDIDKMSDFLLAEKILEQGEC